MNQFKINKNIHITDIKNIKGKNNHIILSDEAQVRIQLCRNYLFKKIKNDSSPIYGVNTGFGALRNIKIKPSDYGKLQTNLIRSHACGAGIEINREIVNLMLLLKVQSLSLGHSGVSIDTVQRLIDFYNNDITPVVYEQGSLGASGDLIPLAHLCLPLIGEGEVWHEGKRMSGEAINKKMGWSPLVLGPKEGLALLNGTQFLSSCGIHLLILAEQLMLNSNTIAALSATAFNCSPEPFNELIHNVRPYKGQKKCAEHLLQYFSESEEQKKKREKEDVQDPYSFRCIPQVHGATMDAIEYVSSVLETEINSVTDNPLIFPEDDKILSGGNFHGHPLAMAFDYVSIALANLGNISERRIFCLLSGQRNLPPFLTNNAGLNSGLMLLQYTAASIVSQNKQLATPASVDSIPSSNGQEDYVSMGANAATKCIKIIDNLKTILAIEFITASQALYLSKVVSRPKLQKLITRFRETVPIITDDRAMHQDIMAAKDFLPF